MEEQEKQTKRSLYEILRKVEERAKDFSRKPEPVEYPDTTQRRCPFCKRSLIYDNPKTREHIIILCPTEMRADLGSLVEVCPFCRKPLGLIQGQGTSDANDRKLREILRR